MMFKPLSTTSPDKRLSGVIGPLVTPFRSSGDALDISGFTANIRSHLGTGQCGVLVAGSTGEAALLDEDERNQLIEAARESVPESAALLVGIGAESTRGVIKRARDCGSRGVDGVLVVAPHYYTASMTRQALLAHFTAVAEASPVPVLLYNIPKYAHLVLEPDLVAELATHPNVVGIKDSSGDLTLLSGYAGVQRDTAGFTLLTGHGPTFSTALRMGARGGILAVALFTGDITPRQYAAFHSSNHKLADELQRIHEAAGREIVGGLGVAGVKAAMEMCGLVGGPVRSPLLPLTDAQLQRVQEFLPQQAAAARTD